MATEQYGNNYQVVWSNGAWVITTVDENGNVTSDNYWEFDDEITSGGQIHEGVSNIQPTVSTSQIVLQILRKSSTFSYVQTTTSLSQFQLLISDVSNIQPVTSTNVINLVLLRSLLTNIVGQTNTSDSLLKLVKTFDTNIYIQTNTSTITSEILRSIVTNIQAQSLAADDVDILIKEIITALANILASTNTNLTRVNILRSLSSSSNVQSATPVLSLQLLITSVTDVQALTSSNSTTSLSILRAVTSNIFAQLSTSSITLEILRSIVTSIQAQSLTSDDVDLSISGIISSLTNILASTDTSLLNLDILRFLSSAINIQSNSATSQLQLLISSISDIQTTTNTNIAEITILRNASSNILNQVNTSTVFLDVLRLVAANIQNRVHTPDNVVLTVLAGLVTAVANIIVSTNTNLVSSGIIRSLLTNINLQTYTSAIVDLLIDDIIIKLEKAMTADLQHYVHNFIISSNINKHQVAFPVNIDSALLEKDTIVELLFNEAFTGSTYKYRYEEVPRSQWPYTMKQRLSIYSTSQYFRASSTGSLNVFNLQHHDLQMADVLLKYRNDSTNVAVINDSTATSIDIVISGNLTTVTANVDLFSTSLSKLIFLYLDLKVNGNYLTYFMLPDVISNDDEVLATCFELKLIDDYFQYIDAQAVSFSLDSST